VIAKARWLSLLAVLLTAALSCGGTDESASEVSSDATPAAAAQATDAANPQLPGALPAHFPEDIPVYADADVAWSRASEDMGVSVRMLSDASLSDVSAYYADDFAAKGWATDIRKGPDGGTLIIADKPTRKAVASVSENEEGRTQVDILFSDLPQ